MKLSKRDKMILGYWFVSCEGFGCEKCEFHDKCEEVRIKIFRNISRDRFIFEDDLL